MSNENEKPKSMTEAFPAAELAGMMLRLDRFDTDVVADERVNREKSLDKLEELTEKIVEENL